MIKEGIKKMAKRQENNYFVMLRELVGFSVSAAQKLQMCLNEFDPDRLPAQLDEMHEIEHTADLANHGLVDKLVKEFITPIEREDIAALAAQLDNITDEVEDVLLRVYMFNVRTLRPEMSRFVELIVRCTTLLAEVMDEFENFRRSRTIKDKIIEINDLEEQGDRLYREAIRSLYAGDATVEEKLIWTELFDCCERCCDACEHTSESVENVIMNNT